MRVPRRRYLLIAFVLAALALIAGGAWVYRAQKASLRADAEAELTAIADLKANQLAQWRAERLGDAAVVMDSPLLIEGVARWLADPTPADGGAILTRFRALQSYYGYDDVLLVDASGQVRLRLSEGNGPLHPEAREAVEQAWEQRRPLIVRLHTTGDGGRPHMGAVAPLFDENGAPVAAVILQVNAESFLYPLIQTWPMPSQSAETLIVRREGDEVLFLNELRHQQGAALKMRIPLTETDVPAVMAVQGQRGVVEGLDYRGVPVVSAIREVPDSPWFLIAKIDRDEIYAEWRRLSALLFGLIAALLAGLAAGTVALWQNRGRTYYQALARSQAALNASESRYRTTLLSVGDGVIVTDDEGRVEIMNAVAEQLTGWPQDDAVGRPLEEVFCIVNEETRQTVESPAARALREGVIVGLANHTLLLARDGAERPIADSGAPIQGDQGAPSGVVLVFRDQTEERAAQEALRESESRFRTLFEASPVAVALYDLEGHLVQCNRTMADMLGYTRQELAEIDPTHPEDRRTGAELFRRLVLGEIGRYQREKRYVRKDGSVLWAHLTAAPILGPRGRPQYVTLVFEDITERKRAQDALRESEAQLRQLLDGAPDPIFVQTGWRFAYVNDAMVALLGARSAQDLLGQPILEHFDPDDRRSVSARIRQLNEERQRVPLVEETLLRMDGTAVLAEVSAVPVHFDGENGALVFVRDITERRRAEAALRESEARFRGLFEHSISGVALHQMVLDEQGEPCDYIYLQANPAFEQHTGIPVSDVIGRRVSQVFANGEPAFLDTYARAALEGEPASFEAYFPPLDRYFSINAFQVLPGQFATVFVDISERKRAEEALASSETRYRRLFEAAQDGILILNGETGRIMDANPFVLDILGYTKEDILGRELWQLGPFRDIVASRAAFTMLQETGYVRYENLPLMGADGQVRQVEFISNVYEAGGNRIIQCNIRDITEHRQAEEALRESERILSTLMANLPGMAYRCANDDDWTLQFVSQGVAPLTGYGAEDLLDNARISYAQVIHPDDRQRVVDKVEVALAEGRPFVLEYRIVAADGSVKWVWEQGRGVTDADGRIEALEGFITDITERKQAEAALVQERGLLRTVIDHLPDAVYVKDAWGRRVLGNPADLRNMGLADEADVLGKMDPEIFDAETAAAYMADDRFVIETGQPLLGREELLVRPDGERRWLLTSKLPLRDAEGRVVGLVGISRDITERKEEEEHRALQALRIETLLRLHEMSEAPSEAIIDSCLQACLDIVQSAHAFIGLMNQDETTLRIHAWSQGAMAQCALESKPLDFRLAGGGLWAECVRQRQPVVINDYAAPHAGKRGYPEGHVPLERLLCVPVFDGGRIVAVAAVANKPQPYDAEDVTALTALMNKMWELLRHQRYDQQLRESAIQYRTLANSGQALIWTAGTDKLCDYFNEPWLAFTGRTLEQELGNGWTEGVHPDDLARCIEIYTSAFDRREPFSMVYRLRRHDGEYRWIRDDGTPRYDAQGNFVGYIGHCLDVTEQRVAEEALRESEERYRRLADHAPDVIFRYRILPEMGLEYINPAVEAATGYTPEECYADPLLVINMAHPDDAPIMEDLAASQQTGAQPFVMRWIGKDGVVRWMETRMIPIYAEDGRLQAVEGITRDITRRIREEQERQQLEQRLQDSQKIEAVGRLAGGVAHDFNNMLQTILGYTEMALQDTAEDSPLHDYLSEIRSAGQRSAALTRQLLAFARRQTLQPQALDLNEHVSGTLKMLGRLIDEDISLVWRPGPNLGQIVMDPSQVDQILANLILNARDAIEGVGEIVIETENATIGDEYAATHPEAIPGEYVVLAVSDSGRGMDTETRSHIFEPFFTTKPVGEGTGLGLATIYGIVKQNEGFINVYSEVGAGTTFRIYLPRKDAPAELEREQLELAPLPRGSETILLVEDEAALLRLGTRLLRELGYTVLAAATPEEAQQLSEEYPGEIHLLMTDVVMPGMNGRELVEVIRPQRPDMRCMYMSGYTANVIAHRGVVDDGVAFLQKPFSLDTLARRVRAALDGSHGG